MMQQCTPCAIVTPREEEDGLQQLVNIAAELSSIEVPSVPLSPKNMNTYISS